MYWKCNMKRLKLNHIYVCVCIYILIEWGQISMLFSQINWEFIQDFNLYYETKQNPVQESELSLSLDKFTMRNKHKGTTINATTFSKSSLSLDITPILDQSPLYLKHYNFFLRINLINLKSSPTIKLIDMYSYIIELL